MYIIHPIIQILATLLALYVLLLGFDRFRWLHLHQNSHFNWKRHVRLGKIASLLWLFGLVVGFWIVQTQWHGVFITGSHGIRALYIAPLISIGCISGWYMDTHKKQRVFLPLLHACANLAVLFLALLQASSGLQVNSAFVLGN